MVILEEDDPLTKLLAITHGQILAIAAVINEARTHSLQMDLDRLLENVTDCSRNIGLARCIAKKEREELP